MLIRKFHIPEGDTLENFCSTVCFVAGAVFLVIALLGGWCHLCTMSVCIAAGLLIKENNSQ